jgi:hypothetical protein
MIASPECSTLYSMTITDYVEQNGHMDQCSSTTDLMMSVDTIIRPDERVSPYLKQVD